MDVRLVHNIVLEASVVFSSNFELMENTVHAGIVLLSEPHSSLVCYRLELIPHSRLYSLPLY